MENQGAFHNFVETSKDASTLARELCILIVFALLFLRPCTLREVLIKVGIQTLQTPLGDVNLGAGGTVAHLGRGISEVSLALKQVQADMNSHNYQAVDKGLAGIMNRLNQAQARATAGNQQIKSNVSNPTGAQCSSVSVPSSGWIYLGLVRNDQWSEGSSKNVSNKTPDVKAGDELTLSDIAYIYKDVPQSEESSQSSNQLANQPTSQPVAVEVEGVFQKGARVTVNEIKLVSALANANFMWARVSRVQ